MSYQLTWPIIVLNLCRRAMVQSGTDPRYDAHQIDGKWMQFAKHVARDCGVRVPRSSLGVGDWSPAEWRTVAVHLAERIDPDDTKFAYYPSGWRDDYDEAMKASRLKAASS